MAENQNRNPLAGANPVTQRLFSNERFRQLDYDEKKEAAGKFFDDMVRDKLKKAGATDEQAEELKQKLKQEVGLFDDATTGVRQSFNPLTDALIAATTAGTGTLSRYGVKALPQALKAAGFAGTAAVPTEYGAGLAAEDLYKTNPGLAMLLETGIGVGWGMTGERVIEKGLRKGAGKIAETATGTFSETAQQTGERVSKAPNIFSDEAEDIAQKADNIARTTTTGTPEYQKQVQMVKDEIQEIGRKYRDAETEAERQQLRKQLDDATTRLNELTQQSSTRTGQEAADAEGQRLGEYKAQIQKKEDELKDLKNKYENAETSEERQRLLGEIETKMKESNDLLKQSPLRTGGEEASEDVGQAREVAPTRTEQPEVKPEPGITVRKDGKAYGSQDEVNRALKRKGMVETHEPVKIDEGQWGFKSKTSREKITQVGQEETQPLKIEKTDKLRFQPVKRVKETELGKFEEVEVDKVIPENKVAEETPLAHEFLSSKISGVSRKYNEGFTKTEVHEGMRNAYNQIRPGVTGSDRHLRVLNELEDLDEIARFDAPKFDPKAVRTQLNMMVEEGKITRQQEGVINNFIDSLSETPNFNVRPQDPNTIGSSYNALSNMIKLDSPTHFFHEAGHWAFYNILGKEDRLGFAEQLMTKYNSQAGWNSLIPSRRKIKAGLTKLLNQGKISQQFRDDAEKHFDKPLELFADMVGQHAWTQQITAPEFKSMIGRTNEAMKTWFKHIRNSGEDLPKEMKEFSDKVFKSQKPQEYRFWRFEDNSQELSNHMFFIPREQVEAGISRDNEVSFFLDRVLRDDVDIERELEGSTIDIERVLDGAWSEMMKWYHGVDVAYDSKDLTRIFDRLSRMFKPGNRIQMEDMLRKVVRTQRDAEGAGPVTRIYDQSRDALTGGETAPATAGQRRSQAERIALDQDAERMAVQQYYDATRQITNDLYGLLEGLKARKMDEFLPAKMPRLRGAHKMDSEIYEVGQKMEYEKYEQPQNKWLRDEEDDAGDPFRLIGEEHYNSARAHVFSRGVPMLMSGAAGLEFDDPDGVPIPGTGLSVSWDPQVWATRGTDVSLPFMDAKLPIGLGPLSAGVAAGGTPRNIGRGVKKVVGKMYDDTGKMYPEVRRFVEEKRERVRKVKNSHFVRSFFPDEGLSPEVAELRRAELEDRTAVLREAERMGREISQNFTREEQRLMADIIEKTGGADLEKVGQDVVDQAEEVRRLHNQMRNMLKEAGYPKEALDKLGDNYLHRIYSRTQRKRTGAKKRVEPERLASAWRHIFGDYIHPRGKVVTLKSNDPSFKDLNTATRGQIKKGDKVYDVGIGDQRYYVHESQKGLLSQLKNDINHTWEVDYADTATRNSKISLRRDWTKLEREELGEVREVVPRMMEYAKMASRDLALANLFKRLNQTSHVIDPSKLSEEDVLAYQNSGWELLSNSEAVKGTGVKKFGSVAGKLVSPDAAQAVKSATDFRSSKLFNHPAGRAWRKLTTMWKLGKTAFNPGTHGRNFVGNMHLCLMDDKNPLKVIRDGISHIRNDTELFREAIDNGMLDSQFLRSELHLDEYMDEMMKATGDTDTELADSLMERFFKGASKAAKKGVRGPMRAYELGDEIFKMGYIADEVAKGRSVKEGLNLAQESFFDYRDIPRGVRAIRDWGIMPFVSYQYKIIPKIAKVAADKPHRLLGILGAYEALNEIGFQQSYGSKAEEQEKFQRRMMPDWMKGHFYGAGPESTIKLPTGDDAPVEYIDMMQSVPGADLMTPEGVLGSYPFGFHPVMSTIYGLATERTPMFDKSFQVKFEDVRTTQQAKQAIGSRAKFLARTWLPNVPFYPGSWSTKSIGNAIVSEAKENMPEGQARNLILDAANNIGFSGTDYHGTPANLPEELIGYLGMGKIRRYYPEEEYIMSLKKLKREISGKRADLTAAARDKRTTPHEFETMKEGYKSLTERNIEIIKELRNLRKKAKSGNE